MADDIPRLRLVDPDERAEPPDEPAPASPAPGGDGPSGRTWISAAVPLCIGIAILAIGLAVSLRLLMSPTGPDDGDDRSDRGASASAPAAPTSTIDPLSLIPRVPTSVGETTTVPAPPTTVAPVPTAPTATGDPTLVPVPVGTGATPAAPPAAAPATGTARVRIFNGFLAGEPLEVWEISGASPVRYGTVPFAGLAEMTAGGRLLPSGVDLQLRFVRPGGDPSAPVVEGTSSKSGPWGWDFTPADGSSQTLVLSPNPGLRVVRIDNLRALGAVPGGKVHVVPVVFHLVLEGTRTKRWAADGVGCLGPLTTDTGEFDVPTGSALRLASADDTTCAQTVTDALVLDRSTAVAVVGVEQAGERAGLVALPLG